MDKKQLGASYVDHMGSDMRAVNAARSSFAKQKENIKPDESDTGLLRYLAEGIRAKEKAELLDLMAQCTDADELYNHAKRLFPQRHWVPFAHNMITLHMSAPIPIRVHCFKHKIGFVESEESRRYISCEPRIFIPDYFTLRPDDVKQGSGEKHPRSKQWETVYLSVTQEAVRAYNNMIADGVSPEEARMILPQGAVVNWMWTGSLFGFAAFYNQRTDPHAQRWTQDLARQVGDIIKPLYPNSWRFLTGGK